MDGQETLSEFYNSNQVKPFGNLSKETAHFNVLNLHVSHNDEKITLPYSRRTYYTVTLLRGAYNIAFEDQTFEVVGDTLLLTTPKIPFGLTAKEGGHTGAFCLFTESFITKHNSGYRLQEFPVFKPGQQYIYELSGEQADGFVSIFNRMFDEKLRVADYSESLQRTYVLELIFTAQRLKPAATYLKTNRTAEEITCAFVRLLEQQFPIESLHDHLKMNTAKDFADQLSIHPVYLNRQVKTVKDRTVSDMIAARILQEAKVLLKLYNWHISEIAYCLGFEEPSHFNSFFKKHLNISPTDYRKLMA